MKAKFSAHFLRWLHPYMADNDIRYYLNGFKIEPHAGGVLLIATNGHRLLVCFDSEGDCSGEMIVRRPPSTMITKCPTECVSVKEVVVDENRLILRHQHEGEIYVAPGKAIIEGHYPDWRRLIKSTDRSDMRPVAAAVQSQYLAELGMGMRSPRWGCSVRLMSYKSDGEGGAIIVEFIGKPALGIIMPMRDGLNEIEAVGEQASGRIAEFLGTI